jgi:Protein kinase domain
VCVCVCVCAYVVWHIPFLPIMNDTDDLTINIQCDPSLFCEHHYHIRPESILVTDRDFVRLTNFMHAKKLTRSNPIAETIFGEDGAKPPEMMFARGYAFSADWWHLGVILFAMVTGGLHPFRGRFRWFLGKKDSRVRDGAPIAYPKDMELSPNCRDVIDSLLCHVPSQRLGGISRYGGREVSLHPFFAKMNWLKHLAAAREDRTECARNSIADPSELVCAGLPCCVNHCQICRCVGRDKPKRLSVVIACQTVCMYFFDSPHMYYVCSCPCLLLYVTTAFIRINRTCNGRDGYSC